MLLGTTAILTATAGAAQELAVDTISVDELEIGMTGYGLTVIRGTEIEEFDVEVLDVIPDGGFDGGPMILARFSGEVIDFADGIAGGYSGSPVYIDDKLLGAVSMAMPYTDTHVGGITPIEQMLRALPDGDDIDYSDNTVLPEPENSGIPVDEEGNRIAYVNDMEAARAFNDRMLKLGEAQRQAVPARTPIFSSGLSPEVMGLFNEELRPLLNSNFELVELPAGQRAGLKQGGIGESTQSTAPLAYKKGDDPPLAPGDACTVSLATGDVELFALGTVTYSDDEGRFLLFGHPMMGEGSTSLPIGKGYVSWVFGSSMRPFKMGLRLYDVGTMTRDHAAACGGLFSKEPPMIPVSVKVRDIDLNRTDTKQFKVVRHNDMTPMLFVMGVSQVVQEVLDRKPSGTVKFSYHIEGAGLKEPLSRTNYYFSDTNVLFDAVFELMPVADLLANNIYREVKMNDLQVLVEITRNRLNASIDDAEIVDPEENETEFPLPEAAQEQQVEDESDSEQEDNGVEPVEIPKVQAQDPVPPQPPSPPDEEGDTTGEEMLEEAMVDPANMGAELPTYRPGDTIRVRVRLQPFREEAIWREFSVKVPEDYVSGSTSVYIHGGGELMSMSELGGKGRDLWGFGPLLDLTDRDLDSILEQIVDAPLNNELVLTLYRPYDFEMESMSPEELDDLEMEYDERYEMEWVIYNSWMLPVNIMTEEDEAAMEEAEAGMEATADAMNGEG
jgi:hypothetical protein